MSIRHTATALAASAGLLAGAALTPALAQTKPAAAPAPAAGAQAGKPGQLPISGPQPDWVKLCFTSPKTNKQVCQTSRDLRAENGQTLSSVAVREEKGAGKRIMTVALPTGMQLQPGVRVVVDSQAPAAGKYTFCMQTVCYADLDVSDGMLSNMKKGSQLAIQVVTIEGRGVAMPLQLAGFGKAFDGPATDPKVFQNDQKKLQEQLEQKAKEALKSLDQGSGQ